MTGDLACAPASERNKHPILEALRRLLPGQTEVLEIGSGWGQHAVFFCKALTGLLWQPTERPEEIGMLAERVRLEGSVGLRPPIDLDVLSDPWPPGPWDVVYTANTAHIMPWRGVEVLFEGAARHLRPAGRLIIYGPFNRNGSYTSTGNQRFDAELRARNPAMGLRDQEALESLAARHQMMLQECIDMPANNLLLVFGKTGDIASGVGT